MFKYIFFIHAPLQLSLASRIIEEENLAEENVLFILQRGMKSTPRQRVNTVDGDRYVPLYGYFPPAYWRENARREHRWQTEVADRLAECFTLYTPSFKFYYQQWLGRKAERTVVLEDGFGNMTDWRQNPKHQPRAYTGAKLPALLYQWKINVARPTSSYRYRIGDVDKLVQTADFYYHVNPLAFPAVRAEKKHRLQKVFTPVDTGKYDGCLVWCPSACVEVSLMGIRDYLAVLEEVRDLLVEKGARSVFIKWHPRQLADPGSMTLYRKAVESNPKLIVSYLEPETNLENLAEGSDLRLITGLSSVAVYAAAAGRNVYSYYHLLRKYSPRISRLDGTPIDKALRNLAEPLEQLTLPA